jgi:hypothetical protein
MSAVNDRPRKLRIRTERGTDGQVRLTVRDAGVGLDPQVMDRLFQAFYTTKNDGMGIGLSVSRSIIERPTCEGIPFHRTFVLVGGRVPWLQYVGRTNCLILDFGMPGIAISERSRIWSTPRTTDLIVSREHRG